MLPSGLSLRPVTGDDDVVRHISAIYKEYDLVYDPEFEDDLYDVGASYSSGAFWVIEDEDGLVATGAVVPNGAARLIKRMYVAARARRLGLARGLLHQCLGWGDFAWSELWSDVRFPAAHQMYQREGFVPGPVRVLTDPDASVERYFRRG